MGASKFLATETMTGLFRERGGDQFHHVIFHQVGCLNLTQHHKHGIKAPTANYTKQWRLMHLLRAEHPEDVIEEQTNKQDASDLHGSNVEVLYAFKAEGKSENVVGQPEL